MGITSKIEWTDATWNPWMGCHKVSQGCKNCYMFREQNHYGNDPNVVRRSKTKFSDPLKWKKPRKIFTCSWSDFFIEEADQWRDDAWEIIRQTPQHTYQILTKRPENILDRLPLDWESGWPNVWLGVSAEDQEYANRRIPYLLRIQAAVRFVSCEPLLGPIDLSMPPMPRIDWVIVGGESGPKARAMNPNWARSLRNQCQNNQIPFFFKQWGAWKPDYENEWAARKLEFYKPVRKTDDDRLLDNRLWEEFPSTIREKLES